MEIKDELIEFLLELEFGVSTEDLESAKGQMGSDLVEKCARKAYRDLNRTLRFNKEAFDKRTLEKKKEGFVDDVVGEIAKRIEQLTDSTVFDTWHNGACEELCSLAKKSNVLGELSYGQAQKWLNMTIKYLWLLGAWDENRVPREHLHVPVDSYILKAAAGKRSVRSCARYALCAPIAPPKKEKEERGHYSEGISKPWSTWLEGEYCTFQKELRKALEDKLFQGPNGKQIGPLCPFDWERVAWTEQTRFAKTKERGAA